MTDLELGKSKLQQALLEISKNYLENLELAPEEDISFSPKLERRMARLLKAKRKPRRNLINAPCKKAIAACLSIIVFAGAIMGCKKIREPIVEFFSDVYEKFTEFFFGDEDKETASKVIDEVHMPTYLPEGYELVEDISFTNEPKEVCIIWKNENDDKIFLYQNVLTNNLILDTENATLTTIDSDSKIAIIQKDNHTYAFWNDRIYSYMLVCNLSEDELIKIVKSIK